MAKDEATHQRASLTGMERYLFDLNGYLILRGALSLQEVAACNESLDALQDCGPGEWRGRVHGHNFTGSHEGLNLQQIYEGGEVDRSSLLDQQGHPFHRHRPAEFRWASWAAVHR